MPVSTLENHCLEGNLTFGDPFLDSSVARQVCGRMRNKVETNAMYSGHPKPETSDSKQKNRKPKLKTRNPKPGTQNPKPETQNPKSETRNPKPETRNSKPKTGNPKPESRIPQLFPITKPDQNP